MADSSKKPDYQLCSIGDARALRLLAEEEFPDIVISGNVPRAHSANFAELRVDDLESRQALPWPPVAGGVPRNNSGRGNHPPRRIVIHSAVMQCRPGSARLLATWNSSGSTGGSWHYAVDPGEALQTSWDSFICWHAPPNTRSIGIEMADWPEPWPTNRARGWFAALRRRWRWLDLDHRQLLHRTAFLTATLAEAYDLPSTWLTPAALLDDERGITSHAMVSRAWRQSSHWDPGAWPRRRFMRLVRRYRTEIRDGATEPSGLPTR